MDWQVTVLATPILLAVAISSLLAGYAVAQLKDGRRESIVLVFFALTLAGVVWTGFSALKLLYTDPQTKLLFYRLLHVGAASLPSLVFLFVVAYTDRTHWLRPELIVGVLLMPGAFVALLFVNPANVVIDGAEVITNDLVVLRVEDGPGFFVFGLHSVGLVFAALGLVLWETRRVGRAYLPQAALITVGLVVPLLFGALTTAGVPPFTDDRINLVPTSAAVSTTALGVLLVRYRLFALPPLAYATAMKYAPDGVLVLDPEARVVHANDHGHQVLAWLDAAVDERLTEYIGGSNPGNRSEELIEIATEDDIVYYRLFVEDLQRGGRHVGWVVVFRDETAQQRQQHRLRRQNEQLDTFATTVSHDLRNPLNVAEGRVELARETGELDHLDDVVEAHERMGVMIDQLLTLARTRGSPEETEPVDIAELAAESWRLVEAGDATLVVRDTLDLVVEGDYQRLRQVFENLYRNAVEHGGSDTTVTVGPLEARPGFFIEDDGPGLPEDHRNEIFELGFSTREEGTGFGLAIVAEIIRTHGWNLTPGESASGGTRFEMTGVKRAKA